MAVTADIPKYRQGPDLDEHAREMNVDLIRERVARKEYEVDAEKVANAIVERLLAVRSAVADRGSDS
jgi:anti-sigma28 factor (negative regulator of flagellin synthesis)